MQATPLRQLGTGSIEDLKTQDWEGAILPTATANTSKVASRLGCPDENMLPLPTFQNNGIPKGNESPTTENVVEHRNRKTNDSFTELPTFLCHVMPDLDADYWVTA